MSNVTITSSTWEQRLQHYASDDWATGELSLSNHLRKFWREYKPRVSRTTIYYVKDTARHVLELEEDVHDDLKKGGADAARWANPDLWNQKLAKRVSQLMRYIKSTDALVDWQEEFPATRAFVQHMRGFMDPIVGDHSPEHWQQVFDSSKLLSVYDQMESDDECEVNAEYYKEEEQDMWLGAPMNELIPTVLGR